MAQRLTDMELTRISLVDKGANARRFAVLKRAGDIPRGNIGKAVPTFASIQASQQIQSWLPAALVSLGQVIDAAIAGEPDDPTVTPELRIQAVRSSAEQFSAQLLDLVATAIAGQPATAGVAKRKTSIFHGLL